MTPEPIKREEACCDLASPSCGIPASCQQDDAARVGRAAVAELEAEENSGCPQNERSRTNRPLKAQDLRISEDRMEL